jgi:hypothetical protein
VNRRAADVVEFRVCMRPLARFLLRRVLPMLRCLRRWVERLTTVEAQRILGIDVNLWQQVVVVVVLVQVLPCKKPMSEHVPTR